MKNKIIIIISLLSLVWLNTVAQNDILLTQQWFSRINRNPASTGNTDDLDFFLLTRRQWMGVKEMPQTNLLNVHSYFDAVRSGLGLSASYDQPGGPATTVVNVKLAYAYHVNLQDELLLSLGVSAGILNKSFDPSKHTWQNPGAPEVTSMEKESKTNADFDFGIELSMPKLLLGASITHLGNTRKSDNSNLSTFTSPQHHYLYARGNFALSPVFDIAPSIVFLNTGQVNMLTVGAMLFYNKMFWVGIDYRPPSPSDWRQFDYSVITGMLGVEWDYFRLGYAYDLSLGKLSDFSSSTHELMLSARIPTKKKTERVRFVQ